MLAGGNRDVRFERDGRPLLMPAGWHDERSIASPAFRIGNWFGGAGTNWSAPAAVLLPSRIDHRQNDQMMIEVCADHHGRRR